MDHLEIEVKFYLSDMDHIRNRIVELGAESQGRAFETNIRFEDADKSLIKRKSLLRLRKDKTTTLTFKSEPHIKDDQFKILRELEVEVNDFYTMKHILESIGFKEEQIYEKWRETLVLKDTKLCMDTMPYGNFLEIEGQKENIKELASRIGLKWQKRILFNYLAIFDIIKQKLNLPFYDVTFSNFTNTESDLVKYLDLLEADSH